MPAKLVKNKDGSYRVESPGGVHSYHTTKENAARQVRLLNAIEHGFKPKGKR